MPELPPESEKRGGGESGKSQDRTDSEPFHDDAAHEIRGRASKREIAGDVFETDAERIFEMGPEIVFGSAEDERPKRRGKKEEGERPKFGSQGHF